MSSENHEPILVRYTTVDTLLYSVRQATVNLPENAELEFAVSAVFGPVSPDDNVFPLLINVEILEPNVDGVPLARALVNHKFVVQGIGQFEREGRYHLPPSLIALLMTQAYATTRGIVLARGAGTVVESLVLPITDPNETFKEYLDSEGYVVLERMITDASPGSSAS